MRNLFNEPLFWEVDTIQELFQATQQHPEAVLFMLQRPHLTEKPWHELREDIFPRIMAYPRIPMQIRPESNAPAILMAELAEAGISSQHSLFAWMLEDFATAYQTGITFFDTRLRQGPKLLGVACNFTCGQESHNQRNDNGKISSFHSDLPDFRLTCNYLGNRSTLVTPPDNVTAWERDKSVDYTIYTSTVIDPSRVYELPPYALALYRGGPTPGNIPQGKDPGYIVDMTKRLPHASPQLRPEDSAERIYFGGNYYLRD